MSKRTIRIAAAFGAALSIIPGTAAFATAAADFPAAVEEILLQQQDGRLARLDAERKHELIMCINDVLAQLPNGKKRFVIEASDLGEREDRFGSVVMENRAEWKQKIAGACAHLAI